MKPVLPFLIAGAASLCLSAAAMAQPGYDRSSDEGVTITARHLPSGAVVRSKVVRYGDLDLSYPRDARRMLTRISGAAREVCSPSPDSLQNLRDVSDYQGCRGEAEDYAVRDLDAPLVTDLYRYGD